MPELIANDLISGLMPLLFFLLEKAGSLKGVAEALKADGGTDTALRKTGTDDGPVLSRSCS